MTSVEHPKDDDEAEEASAGQRRTAFALGLTCVQGAVRKLEELCSTAAPPPGPGRKPPRALVAAARRVTLALIRAGALELCARAFARGPTAIRSWPPWGRLLSACSVLLGGLFYTASAAEQEARDRQDNAMVADGAAASTGGQPVAAAAARQARQAAAAAAAPAAAAAAASAVEEPPPSPDGRGRHAALAVELLAAVRRSGVLEHMSRAVLQLAADEWERRRNADKQREAGGGGGAAAAGGALGFVVNNAEKAAKSPANILLLDSMFLLSAHGELADEWRAAGPQVLHQAQVQVQGAAPAAPEAVEAPEVALGPAAQYLRAAHVVAQVAAAEAHEAEALQAARAADPSFISGGSGAAALGAAAAGGPATAPGPSRPLIAGAAAAAAPVVQQPQLYGLRVEQLPLPLLRPLEDRGVVGGLVKREEGCVVLDMVYTAGTIIGWGKETCTPSSLTAVTAAQAPAAQQYSSSSSSGGGGGVPLSAGAQHAPTLPQQAQLLSDRARRALALRAAHVVLQRWRGYLQLQQQQQQPQPQPGPGRGATPPATSAASVNAAASKAGGVSGSSIDGRGGGSAGPSSSASKPAKPLTQKQLRQHAAAAAKQQQAASKQASKQAAAAAAAAEQRREEKRRDVAEAVAAARREARLKAYRQAGIAQRACSGLAFQSLWYAQTVNSRRRCEAAARDWQRLAEAAAAEQARMREALGLGQERVVSASAAPAVTSAAPAVASAAPVALPSTAAGESAGANRRVGSSGEGAALEDWWRGVVDFVLLMAKDTDCLWAANATLVALLPVALEGAGADVLAQQQATEHLRNYYPPPRRQPEEAAAAAPEAAAAAGKSPQALQRPPEAPTAAAAGGATAGTWPNSAAAAAAAAAAALVAAQRASLYRGLSLGLLPALEALARSIGRQCSSLAGSRGGAVLDAPIAFVEWSRVEHMVLEAAPRRQAAAFIASAAKLTRAVMASAYRQVRAAGGRSAHDVTAAGAAYVSKQRVPLSVLRSMRAGSTGCGRDRGCAAAGDSGSTSEPAAAEPRRVELVSLLASTWLATAADNWAIALNSNSGSGGAVDAAVMPLALSVLEWVPVLVLAHTLALERGDAQAAKEWASFILYDLMPFQSINFVVTTRELSSAEQACVLRAAEALWAALTKDAVERNSGRICRGLLKRTGCWQGGLGRLEQLWATGEAATAARAAVLAELRAGGGGNGSAPEPPAAVAAAVEDVALLLTPSEVRRRLGLCANRGCPNLVGDSEAGLELPVACQVCGAAGRYCGGEDCCVVLEGPKKEPYPACC
ncbi:hypothetical protein HYH02_004781 [Chlamydomonas schloesseri]|uniref:Uncharacterized protein n=1 Tax=Chlamydomonas schloesseri TaxID=2026947 RepID=A0A835WPA3_9CHLO|nr:hypothetical protein HYH02_004781 [Chlamydomonas schloesseri]|eukprot:KAG2450270.1 hypothetical protein HYH02_004781 [Chlamydomonas schloesseri]